MSRLYKFTADENAEGHKLSAFLRYKYSFSGSVLAQLRKRPEAVCANGEEVWLTYVLRAGDEIALELPESYDEQRGESSIVPVPLGVTYPYEDEDFAVADKPYGMPTHPSRAHVRDTLANDFAYRHEDSVFRVLTRLDQDTSGLVLIAKNKLVASLDHSKIERIYYGITSAPVELSGGLIDAPIEREEEFSPKRAVRPDGKPAQTQWRRVGAAGGYTLIRFRLLTGRTHQIRVHCAYMGFPLAGDALYGGDCAEISRQALHAAYLTFENPISGRKTTARSRLPEDMRKLLR